MSIIWASGELYKLFLDEFLFKWQRMWASFYHMKTIEANSKSNINTSILCLMQVCNFNSPTQMLARTKQLTNLMVLISTIQKIHCTETPIPLSLYSFFEPKLYELYNSLSVNKNYHYTYMCNKVHYTRNRQYSRFRTFSCNT